MDSLTPDQKLLEKRMEEITQKLKTIIHCKGITWHMLFVKDLEIEEEEKLNKLMKLDVFNPLIKSSNNLVNDLVDNVFQSTKNEKLFLSCTIDDISYFTTVEIKKIMVIPHFVGFGVNKNLITILFRTDGC